MNTVRQKQTVKPNYAFVDAQNLHLGAKEAGLAELLIRNKKSAEKSDRRIFKLSIAILIVSILGLVVSIIFNL